MRREGAHGHILEMYDLQLSTLGSKQGKCNRCAVMVNTLLGEPPPMLCNR